MNKDNIEYITNLSNMQLGILYQERCLRNVYVESFLIRMNRKISMREIEHACNGLISNHGMLRSVVVSANVSKPLLIVLKDNPVPIETKQMNERSRIHDMLQEEKANGIDISKNALRLVVCYQGDNIQYVIFISHYIFIDGWSSSIIYNDFCKLLNGIQITKEKSFFEFKDNNKKDYDDTIYDGYVGTMFLPFSRSNQISKKETKLLLDRTISSHINEYCKHNNITRATLFYSIYTLLLATYNFNQADFGFISFGRESVDYENTVGLFIKTMPMHVDVSSANVKDIFVNINEWFGRVEMGQVPTLATATEKGYKECNSLFVVENYPFKQEYLETCEFMEVSENTHYDLLFQVCEQEQPFFHMMTRSNNLDLDRICDQYMDLLMRVLKTNSDEKAIHIIQSKSIAIQITAPFQLQYVNQDLIEGFAEFDMNMKSELYLNQDIRQLNKKFDHKIVVFAPGFILDGEKDRGKAREALSAYYENVRNIIQESEYHQLSLIDMCDYIVEEPIDQVLIDQRNEMKLDIKTICESRNNVNYVDINSYNRKEVWNVLMLRTANQPFQPDFCHRMSRIILGCYLEGYEKQRDGCTFDHIARNNTNRYMFDVWSNEDIGKLKSLWEDTLKCEIDDVHRSFMEYGGNSILYLKLIAQIAQTWNLNVSQLSFHIENTLFDQYAMISTWGNTDRKQIEHIEASHMEGPLFAKRIISVSNGRENAFIHRPVLLCFNQYCDKKDFLHALMTVLRRYRLFRSCIDVVNDEIVTCIQDDFTLEMKEYEVDDVRNRSFLYELIQEFDLSTAPLLHVSWIHSNKNYVFFDFCRWIVDEPSIAIIFREIFTVLTGENMKMIQNTFDCFDYYQWYKNEMVHKRYDENMKVWWNEHSSDLKPLKNLAWEESSNSINDIVQYNLERNTVIQIEKFAKRHEITSFTLMLSLYAYYLHHISQQKIIQIGIPISYRVHADILGQPGMMVHTVVYQSVYAEENFKEFIQITKMTMKRILEHKDMLLQDRSEQLSGNSNQHETFCHTMFQYQDYGLVDEECSDVFHEIPMNINIAQSSMDVKVIHSNHEMNMILSYDEKTSNYNGTVRLVTNFINFIKSMILDEN